MNISRSDFLMMRWNILAVCISTLISAAILYSSNEYTSSTQINRRNAQNLLNEARNRLATALQDQESMARYASEYGALIEQNIIGDDRRLDWMEGLEKIRQKRLVADFRYSITPQKRYLPPLPIDSGNFDIRYSEMKLQFDLLHEQQLLDFFDALRTNIKGRYQLEGCTLQRGSAGDEVKAVPAQLKAECIGGWITLNNRGASQ